MSKDIKVEGGCHCGAVRFRFVLPAKKVELLDCNCSMCSRTVFLHLIVAHSDFELLTPREALTSYRFGTRAAEHLFCSTCGVKSFYQPRSHPEAWSVNYHGLDDGHGLTPTTVPFDGRNWEAAQARLDRPAAASGKAD
ncbi:MAG: GFA family protein [Sphingomonadales bacterium]|nr:GFA family protein [Sphingomonadales bacterium]MBK9002958.1 GFA family protein [Sphingomonadales bacterium]MBK9268206.1 GFA family protein [Sphingomonadales bacterium]MBP6434233.1 GFA family protein [Sphingorhabdus sp.]